MPQLLKQTLLLQMFLSISSADKVVVGKKSKGFTFTGATTANGITISNSDRIKIEGNVSENNEKGFNLDTTDRIQVSQ